MPPATSASSRSRSSTTVGGRRSRSAHRWRSRARATAWNVPASTWSRTPERRSRRRSSPAASRVNVRASVWRASAVPDGDAVGDAPGEHAGLARAGAGDDGDQRRRRRDGGGCVGSSDRRAVRRRRRSVGLGAPAAHRSPYERGRILCGAMPYPKKLLNDNETLVLDLHPHWWYFVEAAVALVASIVLGIVALAAGLAERRSSGSPSCSSSASAIWLVVRYVKWLTTNFVVTSDRVDLPPRRVRQERHRDPARARQQRALQPGRSSSASSAPATC